MAHSRLNVSVCDPSPVPSAHGSTGALNRNVRHLLALCAESDESASFPALTRSGRSHRACPSSAAKFDPPPWRGASPWMSSPDSPPPALSIAPVAYRVQRPAPNPGHTAFAEVMSACVPSAVGDTRRYPPGPPSSGSVTSPAPPTTSKRSTVRAGPSAEDDAARARFALSPYDTTLIPGKTPGPEARAASVPHRKASLDFA